MLRLNGCISRSDQHKGSVQVPVSVGVVSLRADGLPCQCHTRFGSGILWFLCGRLLELTACLRGLFLLTTQERSSWECPLQVLSGETFLDGVLNSVALIFIAEIDDHLPRLLELDTRDIVQSFLIDQSIIDYDDLSNPKLISRPVKPIEFSDMFLTNTQESGSIASKGVTFQPYEVFGNHGDHTQVVSSAFTSQARKGSVIEGSTTSLDVMFQSRKRVPRHKAKGHVGVEGQQVANKRAVTSDCLLRKIQWQYTKGYDQTCTPRVGHLRLTKLNAPKHTIDIIGKNKETDESLRPFFSVTGVFIITCFSMSDDILR
jgi:hypothetical protein